MNPWLVIILSLCYLAIIFLIAFRAQKKETKSRTKTSAWIYSLSLGVYCTAWTYYGSIGKASRDGIEFLAVYIGPVLVAPLSWVILRKIIRISNVQRTTTIADFISSRYGKNISLGSIVTLVCFVGIVPYIALQLKAISESFDIITGGQLKSDGHAIFHDTSFYVVLIMATFTLLFGTRRFQTTERHQGMMAAIAFESVIKLIAVIALGLYLTYGLFHGFGDLFGKASQHAEASRLLTMNTDTGYREWFWITLLSALAFILLPRQFQVSVVENTNENDLRTSMWVFPGYLFLINLFVLPIAVGGMILLSGTNAQADYYMLHIPMSFNQSALALFIFIGGISAATSMIIVETMALSTMFSNNLLIPLVVGNEYLKSKFSQHLSSITIWSRRFSIVMILILAWVYYHHIDQYYSLVSIGLISFVSVAQFAPAMLGGIFWKKATKAGAVTGIVIGFAIWLYTLVIPSLIGSSESAQNFLTNGPFGIGILKPYALFGLEGYGTISHAMFWSMFFNIVSFIAVSLNTTPSIIEKNQSEIFVDIYKYSAVYESTIVLKGKASLPDLEALLAQFFGMDRSKQVIRLFAKKHEIDIHDPGKPADHRIIAYAERLLSGVIGSASARIMISSIMAEEEIRLDEVVNILKESQQILSTNRELKRKSEELRSALDELAVANTRLQENDQLKDDFLSTVTHELRTPITSIRAFSEILFDNPDLDGLDRQHYLSIVIKETERLSRLISQVLDLERYESGRQKLTLSRVTPRELIQDSVEALDQLIREKNIQVQIKMENPELEIVADRDKLIQVLLNLLSNSLKFIENEQGRISITTYTRDEKLYFEVVDNGKGIAEEYQQLIFEKFFQAKNQLTRKPKGTGLGLAICKKIMLLHKGDIDMKSAAGQGAQFTFWLPEKLDEFVKETEDHYQQI